MNPKVSVCIANYNGIDLINACIASVRAQDCDFAVEIVVHDDASTDGSADHIRADHPDVKLISSVANVGFCLANNRMAEVATGEYLLLLNNDAELFPDALRVLESEARTADRAAILGLPQYDHASGELIDRGCFLDPFFNPVPNRNPAQNHVAMVIGACMWIPRRLWKQLGGFPDWFSSIGEDLFLCCVARLAGYLVKVPDSSGYYHRVGQSFGGGRVSDERRLSTTLARRALSERNKTFSLCIAYPFPVQFLALPVHLGALLLEGLILAAILRSPSVWTAVYAPIVPNLWRARHSLLYARREVQERRAVSLWVFLQPFRWLPRKLELLYRYGFPRILQPS